MFEWIKQIFGRKQPITKNIGTTPSARQKPFEAQFSVSFDDKEIKLVVPNGKEYAIEWDKLIGVAIQTTDEGPFQPDVFWVLGTKENSLRIPHGAQGDEKLLHRLQQLPGFDHKEFISAMGSANDNMFICWQKEKKEI
jgi:hypothetical protein